MPPGKDDGEREGTLETLQGLGDGLLRAGLLLQVGGQQMDHGLAVGLGFEDMAGILKLAAQFLEVLDDAVMHDGDPVAGMGMGIGLGRPAVRRPAGVADPDRAGQRRASQQALEIDQLALCAAAVDAAVHQGRHAGGVVPPVLQPLQSIDQQRRGRGPTENSDDPAHG